MGIRESLLNTITSVGNGDFVRIVTSAGASSKATVANLFKSFESGLSAKSSLTTSDYIRVVGSDNVSYKQLVSGVKAKFGLSWHTYSQTTKEELLAKIDSDINDVGQGTIVGYMVSAQATLLGLPSASYYFIGFNNSANYRDIRFTNTAGTAEYLLSKQDGTWASSPIALPTRAEMDSYNNHGLRIGTVSGTGSTVNMRETPGGTIVKSVPVGQKVFVIGTTVTSGTYKCAYIESSTGTWYQGCMVTQYVTIE